MADWYPYTDVDRERYVLQYTQLFEGYGRHDLVEYVLCITSTRRICDRYMDIWFANIRDASEMLRKMHDKVHADSLTKLYISRLETRWSYFEMIRSAYGREDIYVPPSAEVLAMVFVAPYMQYRIALGALLAKNVTGHEFRGHLEASAEGLRRVLKAASVAKFYPMIRQSSSPFRRIVWPADLGVHRLQEAAKRRDREMCYITGEPDPVVTNILCCKIDDDDGVRRNITLPTYLDNNLCDMLWWFWPQQAASWCILAKAKGHPDHCTLTEASLETVLCMSKRMSRLWQDGAFGLEPIHASSSPATITLKLHWLKRGDCRPITSRNLISHLETKTALELLCGSDPMSWGRAPSGCALLAPPGKIIQITAGNPAKLPNMALLELRWTLSRLLALVGEIGTEHVLTR